MERERHQDERAVVVTTAHRGVFFGYARETGGDTIRLRRGRNCLYWTTEMRGFVGLAAYGPSAGCNVGPAADMELRDITAVLDCPPEAASRWESHE